MTMYLSNKKTLRTENRACFELNVLGGFFLAKDLFPYLFASDSYLRKLATAPTYST